MRHQSAVVDVGYHLFSLRPAAGQKTLELYGSNSWFGSFDRAMIAFLQCLREFGEFAEHSDASLKLPYHIEGECNVAQIPHHHQSASTVYGVDLAWLLA